APHHPGRAEEAEIGLAGGVVEAPVAELGRLVLGGRRAGTAGQQANGHGDQHLQKEADARQAPFHAGRAPKSTPAR
ncbi:hypothetical protein OEZ81_25910, partial [Leclercia adecarboxylata]|uniref:hypothetical protein n=1 Tax=Leclercia adecarboxylata TaxID=83655 RepID=UPI00234DC63E